MADSNAVNEVEASVANLLLDEVTGERVSKTELKKRQKMREREAKKKEKEANAPPKPEKKVSAEEEEANLTPNVCSICTRRNLSGYSRLSGFVAKIFFLDIAILRDP
jgi:cobalamin-dependent methionine synthase I